MKSPYLFYICRLSDKKFPTDVNPSVASFVLIEDDWNDFGVCSQFEMHYLHPDGYNYTIGNVKIVLKSMIDEHSISDPIKTSDYIHQDSFSSISELGGGCSLGQDKDYYLNLLRIFKDAEEVLSILDALSDCALDNMTYEEMVDNPCFHSLVRYDAVEQLRRTARLLVYCESGSDLYYLNYNYHTPYNEDVPLKINFNFQEKECFLPRRLYAIIGENGVGKTNLLNQLTIDYLGKEQILFADKIPPFSKIIRVSTSIYDDYTKPQKSRRCDFEYCGIKREELTEGKSLRQILEERTLKSLSQIRKYKGSVDGEDKLYRILEQFLSDELLDRMYTGYEFSDKNVLGCLSKMSSGECNMFFMITDILANIRLNSLILFDEPELHMHPNAITVFMNIIYSILDEYQSFAIIATHSPLIVREVLGENVYVMERHENIPIVRNIGMESFAANLTDLYGEIFSNKNTTHYYETLIAELRNKKFSYEEVKNNLRSQYLDPNMNMRLLIMNMFASDDEED